MQSIERTLNPSTCSLVTCYTYFIWIGISWNTTNGWCGNRMRISRPFSQLLSWKTHNFFLSKAKESSTVTVIWISDLYCHNILRTFGFGFGFGFYKIIVYLKSYIKLFNQCFIRYLNTSKSVLKTSAVLRQPTTGYLDMSMGWNTASRLSWRILMRLWRNHVSLHLECR